MIKYIVLLFGVLLVMSFIFPDFKSLFVKLQQPSSPSFKKRYLLIRPVGGLTNQRLCILYALYHSSLYNYTLVKPNLTQCCPPLYHNNQLSVISFDTFYSLYKSISYVDELPAHHQKECQRQLKESQNEIAILDIAKN